MKTKCWNQYHESPKTSVRASQKSCSSSLPHADCRGIMENGDAQEISMNKNERIHENQPTRKEANTRQNKESKDLFLGKYTLPKKPCKSTGYYNVNVRCSDTKSGRRQIKAKTIEELKQKLIDYDAGIDLMAKPKTFDECFHLAMEEILKYTKDPDKKLSAQASIQKYESDYRRFLEDTSIARMYIADIRATDIERSVFENLKMFNLSKKRLSSLRLLFSKTFSYAMQHHLIGENIYTQRCNFSKFKDMTVAPAKTKDRVHSRKELAMMRSFIQEKQRMDPSYLPAYAMELQMLLGLRRGEVPPLQWDDIIEDELGKYLSIDKIQVTVKKSRYNPKEYDKIVPHTKTGEDREIPIFPELADLLSRIRYVHKRFQIQSDFIFPANSETGCITNYTVYGFYRRMCKKLGIILCREQIKGPHSFRRNVGSRIVNNSGGNVELATQILGNSPEVFREHYYTGAERIQMVQALSGQKTG